MKRLFTTGIAQTLGGFCTLIIAMGIGRFAYTALLPGMMNTFQLSEQQAGILAAWNYAGYLAGVLLIRKETHGKRRYMLLSLSLLFSLITTAAMGLTPPVLWWYVLRFLAGAASGACFVLCSAIVLDTLASLKRPELGGVFYSGVGTGIALGGLGIIPLTALSGLEGAWLGLALFSVPLMLFALFALRPAVNFAQPLPEAPSESKPKHQTQRGYIILLVVYFLEGFGYIIGTTFLVALVENTSHSPALANAAWVITGLAAALITPLWRYAARKGYLPMLILAFLLQAGGVLIPAVSATPAAALLGGFLLGGTFMGITVLSLQYAITLSGKSSAHTVAIMTAVYGIGQIAGPFIAGFCSRGEGFTLAFILSSFSLFIAAGLLLFSAVLQHRVITKPT